MQCLQPVTDESLTTISGRVPSSLVPRLDRIREALSMRAAGARLKRSDAIRAAIERGVEALESELGIVESEPSKPAPKGGKPARKPK
jgi:hypothetical protein